MLLFDLPSNFPQTEAFNKSTDVPFPSILLLLHSLNIKQSVIPKSTYCFNPEHDNWSVLGFGGTGLSHLSL
jgi:hypothetical protein